MRQHLIGRHDVPAPGLLHLFTSGRGACRQRRGAKGRNRRDVAPQAAEDFRKTAEGRLDRGLQRRGRGPSDGLATLPALSKLSLDDTDDIGEPPVRIVSQQQTASEDVRLDRTDAFHCRKAPLQMPFELG